MTSLPFSHRGGSTLRNGSAILPMMTVLTLLIVLAIAAVAATTAVWTLVGGTALLMTAVVAGVAWLVRLLGDEA